MHDAVNLNAMGARGNGRKDNYAVFQRILDTGARKIILEKGDYFISKPLIVNVPDVEIIGQGADKTVLSGDHHLLFDVRSNPIVSWMYPGEIHPGSHSITNPHGDLVGKDLLIHISAPHGMPEMTSGGYTSHHTALITDTRDDQILLGRSIEIPFKHDIRISVYRAAGFTMRNLTLETDNTPYFVEIRNRQNVRFINVVFRTPRHHYMGEYRSSDPHLGVSGIAAYGCVDVTVDSCRFEHTWYGLMAHEGCDRVNLQNSTAFASRHICNNGIGTDHFRVENCVTERCEGGFNSHPTALGTTFVNCKDLQSNARSTFDGRRDSIINCVFDHGIRLSTDEGIIYLAEDSTQSYKMISGTRVSGDQVAISASNVRISDCLFKSPVLPSLINGNFKMDDVTIDLTETQSNQSAAITIADSPADGSTYTFSIRNLTVIGPQSQNAFTASIGVYVPMRPGTSGDLENVLISGFEKGLVMYGGEESKERYKGVGMMNVQIRDCDYGIYQQDFFDKPLRVADIRISECRIDDNAPGRIKRSQEPGN